MSKKMVHLKPIAQVDLDILAELLTDDTVKQTYMLPDFGCRKDAIPLFNRLITLSLDSAHYVRGIYCDDTLIGFLNDVEIKDGSIELGYVIHPRFHGKGYMTQALKIAIEALFSAGYREVITGAFEENKASIRVMEKAGMICIEKTEEIEYRGKTHNCVYYHIEKSKVSLC